jgi:iron complex transport system substrate-binding protein
LTLLFPRVPGRGLSLKSGLSRFKGVAPGSLQGHFMERAGFKNIVPETRNEMPLLSSEWVAGATPDVIFHTGLTSADHIAARAGWKRIPAVQNNRIVFLDADLFSRAGPRVIEALAELHRVRREVGP